MKSIILYIKETTLTYTNPQYHFNIQKILKLSHNFDNFLPFSLFIPAILQRTTVDIGQIKIQSVATCLFLCMDQCGFVYGSVSVISCCFFVQFILFFYSFLLCMPAHAFTCLYSTASQLELGQVTKCEYVLSWRLNGTQANRYKRGIEWCGVCDRWSTEYMYAWTCMHAYHKMMLWWCPKCGPILIDRCVLC